MVAAILKKAAGYVLPILFTLLLVAFYPNRWTGYYWDYCYTDMQSL